MKVYGQKAFYVVAKTDDPSICFLATMEAEDWDVIGVDTLTRGCTLQILLEVSHPGWFPADQFDVQKAYPSKCKSRVTLVVLLGPKLVEVMRSFIKDEEGRVTETTIGPVVWYCKDMAAIPTDITVEYGHLELFRMSSDWRQARRTRHAL